MADNTTDVRAVLGASQGPSLTDAQAKAWPQAIARLREHYDSIPDRISSWDVVYAEETRPGRGHHINATWVDGEVFAQILMDVYGYPNISVAALSWIHADSDEECACAPCERDNAENDEPSGPAEGS